MRNVGLRSWPGWKIFSLTITVTFFPALLVGQEQTPFVFDVGEVVVGAKRIETLSFGAVGRWSDADTAGVQSTEIHCYRRFAWCEEAQALLVDGEALVVVDEFDIIRWDTKELIAVDSSPPCVVRTLRADFGTKGVTKTMAQKGGVKDHSCDGFEASTAFLGGLNDEKKRVPLKEKKTRFTTYERPQVDPQFTSAQTAASTREQTAANLNLRRLR